MLFRSATGKPGIEFIKKCLEKNWHPLFLGQSALGSLQVRDALKGQPVEIYMSEVVPNPLDQKLLLARNFQKHMSALNRKDLNFFSLEGYMGAMLFVEAARRAGHDLTRASLEQQLASMSDFDLGGVKASFNSTKHYALSSNFVFHLKDGQLTQMN